MQLSEYEFERQREYLNKIGYNRSLDFQEDCTGMPNYHYEVYTSGIGDTVYLVHNGNKVLLSDMDAF